VNLKNRDRGLRGLHGWGGKKFGHSQTSIFGSSASESSAQSAVKIPVLLFPLCTFVTLESPASRLRAALRV
jgi:hypothetical protein